MNKNDFSVLLGSAIFTGIDENALHKAVSAYGFEEKSYKKHEDIFTPECYSDALAVILRGSADVYKQTQKGKLFLSILRPGDIFGMAALFYEENGFINTVSAREDCKVLFITKPLLEKLFTEYPVTATNYITVLSKKIHYLNSKISCLTSASPTGRLLSWLIGKSEELGSTEFILPVSYSELARILSLGRTSLYRSFDELTSGGRLLRDGKKITLL